MKEKKLLWIDDSQEWVISVQDNLDIICKKNNIHFNYVNLKNGDDIIQQCRNIDFDIILMDYDMEPFTGEKYIGDIREEEHLESIEIIFYSYNNSIDLNGLVSNYKNVRTIYKPHLEQLIIDKFLL